MSFKLFLLNAFGGLKATSKIEAERESLLRDYQVFTSVEQSDELKEFLQLQETVNSPSFKKMKAELAGLKFKGSAEEGRLKQFNKLSKNGKLKKYYQAAGSADLKRYENLKNGNQLDRYFELKKMVAQPSENGAKEAKAVKGEYKTVASSPDVRFFLKYPKSAVYRNYPQMKDSEEKRKYEELKELVGSEEFLSRKAYLEDPEKWEKTPEYVQEKRYLDLRNKPELVLYFKYKDSAAFDFFKQWNLIFEDRFENEKLDAAKWKTINYWAEKTIGRNFSQEGDLQAFGDGKNIHLKGSRLQIQVKKDKLNSLVWRQGVGFMEQEFNYSSDTMTTGGLFSAQYGILEAKIKYDPDKSFQDVFYLAGEDNAVRLALLETGLKNRFGLSKSASGKMIENTCSLSGLSAGKMYLFRMEWERGKITWKINDKELFAIQTDVPDYPMFLNLACLVIAETNKLPHNFEIDWIRFYQKRK